MKREGQGCAEGEGGRPQNGMRTRDLGEGQREWASEARSRKKCGGRLKPSLADFKICRGPVVCLPFFFKGLKKCIFSSSPGSVGGFHWGARPEELMFKLFVLFRSLAKFGVQWYLKTELRTQTENLADACSVLVTWMCVTGGCLRAHVRAIWGMRMRVSLGWNTEHLTADAGPTSYPWTGDPRDRDSEITTQSSTRR